MPSLRAAFLNFRTCAVLLGCLVIAATTYMVIHRTISEITHSFSCHLCCHARDLRSMSEKAPRCRSAGPFHHRGVAER